MKQFKLLSFAATLLITSGASWASPACNKPQSQWMPESAFRTQIEQQGYTIQKFKITSNKCYEIYGRDKNGAKAEIYFDPVTAEVLARK